MAPFLEFRVKDFGIRTFVCRAVRLFITFFALLLPLKLEGACV